MHTMKKNLIDSLKMSTRTDLEIEKITASQLLELGLREQDYEALAFGHTYLADYYILSRQQEHCLYHMKEAISICEQQQFYDLLPLAYTIAGMYYEAHFDEMSALQYYLDGYKIAKERQDYQKLMVILNNISILFSDKGDIEASLAYLERAYRVFLQKGTGIINHSDLLVILNLVQLYIQNNKLEEAAIIYQQYMPDLKATSKQDLSLHVILLSEMYLAEAYQKFDYVRKIADYFANSDLHQQPNHTIYFSFYHDIFMILLRAQDMKRAERFLQLMGEICQEDDIDQQLKLHLNWIHFAETFHLENTLINSYKQYYLLQKMVSDITNKTKSDSMKEKIIHHHILQEKEDILKEKNLLEAKIKIDGLTKLFNRTYFNTLADFMQNNAGVHNLGFILVDVDFFKEYNDYYGHHQGDILLQKLASCLDQNGDSRFFTARYGGDEFITLSVNVTNEEIDSYLTMVYKDLHSLQIEHKASPITNIATISAGYAIFDKDENFNYEDAITLADAALYKAKADGKNQYSKY